MADIIKTATRDAYGKALIELGHKDKNCCRFSCDRSYRICKFVCNVRCRESL